MLLLQKALNFFQNQKRYKKCSSIFVSLKVHYIYKKNWNHNQKTPLKAWKNKAKNVVTTSGHSIEVLKSSHKAKCVQQHISFNHTRDCLTWSSNTKTFLASHTIYSSYIYTSFNLLQNRKSTSTYFLLLPIWLWIL